MLIYLKRQKTGLLELQTFDVLKDLQNMKTALKIYVKGLFIARKVRNFTKIINSVHISMAVN